MKSRTDEQIHHDVLHELRWDNRVEETEVGVEVDKGVVTLTGTGEAVMQRKWLHWRQLTA